ncbi:cell division protein ZapD [Pleionea sp. CnH1-48]|uniref:cell division protein ZapD n=1 Tax=Pleionea sp. CnH1-48 TaxID=2954494 RepID=UPI002097BC91|nr:cell division protein ZapD [Pleionea sp. CnH1-48]MCO7223980.1 cell division protein ZapD [Pleionea sp. CnH1-48]
MTDTVSDILFEHPLNQPMRNFLRLESMLRHLSQSIFEGTRDNHQSAVLVLIKLLDTLTRGDIKGELIKELEIQQHHFQQLVDNPAVDSVKLKNFLKQLEKLHHWAINSKGRIGDELRRQPFIESLVKKEGLLAGATSFDSPELCRFIALSEKSRKEYFKQWMTQLNGLRTSIEVLLRLTREMSAFEPVTAPLGDYLIEKPDLGASLLRIALPADSRVFPEVSAGKHRISIHFYTLSTDLIKKKVSGEIPFKYATCGWKVSSTHE